MQHQLQETELHVLGPGDSRSAMGGCRKHGVYDFGALPRMPKRGMWSPDAVALILEPLKPGMSERISSFAGS